MHELWRQKTPLHLTAYYIDKKEIMVLKGEISPSKRAYILHLTHEKKLSIWIKQNNTMFHKPQSTGKKITQELSTMKSRRIETLE